VIVLDTNVFSESLNPSPSAVVLRWLASQEPLAVFLTAVSLAEVRYGVETMAASRRRKVLQGAHFTVRCDDRADLPFPARHGRDAQRG
jgi:predicted nucleic acid-binding protein